MKTNNKGFSLVELIVVIAIMAILAAVAIPTFSGFITKAKISNDVSFVNDVTYAAKIASVEYAGDVTVSVTVDDGNITSITVTKKSGETTTFNAVMTSTSVTSSSDATVAEDIKGSIDWTYTFSNYKEDGTYTLGADGKTLVKS